MEDRFVGVIFEEPIQFMSILCVTRGVVGEGDVCEFDYIQAPLAAIAEKRK